MLPVMARAAFLNEKVDGDRIGLKTISLSVHGSTPADATFCSSIDSGRVSDWKLF